MASKDLPNKDGNEEPPTCDLPSGGFLFVCLTAVLLSRDISFMIIVLFYFMFCVEMNGTKSQLA